MRINDLMEMLYLYLIEPKKAIKKDFNFKYTTIIYFISIISISISALYSSKGNTSIISILLLPIILSIYLITSNFIKISVTTLLAYIISKNDNKNIKSFIKNYFELYSVYIFLLPITLIFSFSNHLYIIQTIIAIIIQIYYIILIYHNIKYSFNIENSLKAFIILLSPIIIDFINYTILALLILAGITKII